VKTTKRSRPLTAKGGLRRTLVLVVALLWTIGSSFSSAYGANQSELPKPAEPTKPAESTRPSSTSLLDIKLEPSRPQPAAGTGLGITAELRNTSPDSILYLRESNVTLTLPPELEGPFEQSQGWYALFPTEPHPPNQDTDAEIALHPGDVYQVIWTRNPSHQSQNDQARQGFLGFISSLSSEVATELRFVLFAPGDYKINVNVKYWTDPNYTCGAYRTWFQSAVLHVAAPQFVILFGAVFGGLIAYYIVPRARRSIVLAIVRMNKRPGMVLARLSKELVGATGSVLISTIATILLSRLSETQFLIRITVNDVWGAMAVGFVANFAGLSWLNKLIPKSISEQQVNDDIGRGEKHEYVDKPQANEPQVSNDRADATAFQKRAEKLTVEESQSRRDGIPPNTQSKETERPVSVEPTSIKK